jgi:hypothetical protein
MTSETLDAPIEESEALPITPAELKLFTCVRCGYEYKKVSDFEPYLCYRCLRFLAKKVWTLAHTIQPAISRPDVVMGDV